MWVLFDSSSESSLYRNLIQEICWRHVWYFWKVYDLILISFPKIKILFPSIMFQPLESWSCNDYLLMWCWIYNSSEYLELKCWVLELQNRWVPWVFLFSFRTSLIRVQLAALCFRSLTVSIITSLSCMLFYFHFRASYMLFFFRASYVIFHVINFLAFIRTSL